MNALRGKIGDLRDRLSGWIKLLDSRPDAVESFREDRIRECREAVQKSGPEAVEELRSAAGDSTQHALAMASKAALQMLEQVRNLFNNPTSAAARQLDVRDLLNADLAYVPGIDWHPQAEDSLNLNEAEIEELRAGAACPLKLEDAFQAQTSRRNHAASAALLDAARAGGAEAQLLADFHQQRAEALIRDRLRLQEEVDLTDDRIAEAVCYDLVNDTDRASFVSEVEDIRVIGQEAENLQPQFKKLEQIREELKRLKGVRLGEVRKRLDNLVLPPDRRGDRKVIEDTLAAGDFATADEYIGLASEGQQLQAGRDEAPPPLDDFFPTWVNMYSDYLQQSRVRLPDLIEQLKQGRSFGPGLLPDASQEERRVAANLLEAWRQLSKQNVKRDRRHRELKSFLSGLGFTSVKCQALLRDPPGWIVDVDCSPVENAGICSIPQFGSLAGGCYSVLGLPRRSNDEEFEKRISEELSRPGDRRPLIVFYFGAMDVERRRRMARWAWGKRSFLLIDDILAVYLTTHTDGRLGAFFRCTLPLATAQPYTTTASHVPIEMFFGRKKEYQEIVSRDGANLVYGGRQLGKSALLREIERREHNAEHGAVVRWIDLKNRGIGIHSPPEGLWPVIAAVLHSDGVLSRQMRDPESIRRRVVEWLEADPQRRILLLLDEADAFLEQDSVATARHSFPVVSGLKGLMDDTNRRFKVVFAGLHNVQRAARDPNTPVAHLGTPVNIGPLLNEGQWKQARALVEKPLGDLGFRFAAPNLSLRILSHANFYPSLIQIFCKHLIQSFHDRAAVEFRDSPPYRITMDDIDRVYQTEGLQKEIRDRFEWTLKLDPRYRLIALLIALRAIEAREGGEPVEGASVQSIRKEGLDLWREGFAQGASFEQFRITLDEMVGLGVLRRVSEGRYALRSANVLNLLGSRSRIEEMLFDVAESPPPPVYEPAAFRRTLQDGFWVRSPLTAEQEGSLLERSNGVAVITGSPLAGIDQAPDAVRHISDGDVQVEFNDSADSLGEFQQWLRDIDAARRQRREGVTLAVVTRGRPWNAAWVQHALGLVRGKRSATVRFLRVIFMAGPRRAWCCGLTPAQTEQTAMISLRPWSETFIERWLEDNELNRDNDSGRKVREVTGGWGRFVQELGQQSKHDPHLWENRLAELQAGWQAEGRRHLADEIPDEARDLFAKWVEGGGDAIDQEMLEVLLPGCNVSRVLQWADQLGYVRPAADAAWEMEPMLLCSRRNGAAS